MKRLTILSFLLVLLLSTISDASSLLEKIIETGTIEETYMGCDAGASCVEAYDLGPISSPENCIDNFSERFLSTCLDHSYESSDLPQCQIFRNHPISWYRTKIDTSASHISVSAFGSSQWTPSIAVFQGNNCGDMINLSSSSDPGVFCSTEGSYASTILVSTEDIENQGEFIWIAVTGVGYPAPDDLSFDLYVRTTSKCEDCEKDYSTSDEEDLTIEVMSRSSDRPLNDPTFEPGEEVEICASLTFDPAQDGVYWLHGIIPDFGLGWDLSDFDPDTISVNNYSGVWMSASDPDDCRPYTKLDLPFYKTFYDKDSILRLSNTLCANDGYGKNATIVNDGDPLPSGWFFNTPGGSPECGTQGCRSTNYFGLPGSNMPTQVDFCFNAKVKNDLGDCLSEFSSRDLNINFFPTTDLTTGCWNNYGFCSDEKLFLGPKWKVDCKEYECDVDTVLCDVGLKCRSAFDLGLISTEFDCDSPPQINSLASCLDYSCPDPTVTECDVFATNPVAWFVMEIDGNAGEIVVNVSDYSGWDPAIVIYQGPYCFDKRALNNGSSDLINCSTDSPSSEMMEVIPFDPSVAGNFVWIAVSGTGIENAEDLSFTLSVSVKRPCLDCTTGDFDPACIQDEEVLNIEVLSRTSERALDDPRFIPGESVEICVDYSYNASQTGIDWLHGIIPDFGEGWDLVSFSPDPITTPIGIQGEWMSSADSGGCIPEASIALPNVRIYYDDDGVLRFCHLTCNNDCPSGAKFVQAGDPLPSGWFFNTQGGSLECGTHWCNSTNWYGLVGSNSITTLNFCFEIKVKDEIPDCEVDPLAKDLSINILPTSDLLSGCWQSTGFCVKDELLIGPEWEIDCKENECDVDTVLCDVGLKCGSAFDMGLVSTPPDCNSTPEIRTLESCLDYSCPDPTVTECDVFATNPVAWYVMEIDDNAGAIFVNVSDHSGWDPAIALYQGMDCNSLIPLPTGTTNPTYCSTQSPPFDFLGVLPFDTFVQGQFIWIAISGTGIEYAEDLSFTLSAYSKPACLDCTTGYDPSCIQDEQNIKIEVVSRTSNRTLEDPYFIPGETVEICVDYSYNASQSGIDWLQGVIPKFGNAWDVKNFNPQPIVSGDYQAEWLSAADGPDGCIPEARIAFPNVRTYYDEDGVLRFCHLTCDNDCPIGSDARFVQAGDPLPSGWFFNTTGASQECGDHGCNSTNYYGLPASNSLTQLNFCFEISVKDEIPDCENNLVARELNISVFPTTDDLTGCWNNQNLCVKDELLIGPEWEVECVDSPGIVVAGSREYCSGKTTDITLTIPDNDIDVWVEDDMGTGAGSQVGNQEGSTDGFGSVVINELLTNESNSAVNVTYFIKSSDPLLGIDWPIELLVVTVDPSLMITFDSFPSELCVGNTVDLTYNQAGGTAPFTYEWTYPDGSKASDATLTLTGNEDFMSGTYTLKITDVNGCTATEEMELNLLEIEEDFEVSVNGPEVVITYNGTGENLSWDLGNGETMENDSTLSYTYTESGDYTITLSGSNACGEFTVSKTVTIVITSAEDIGLSQFKIFPNPTADEVFIQAGNDLDRIQKIDLIDVLGHRILSVEKDDLTRGKDFIKLDLSHLSNGSYLIHIHHEGGKAINKLVKI